MGSFSPFHWVLIAILVLVLFGGRGKLSSIMGDAAKGVRAFKDGLKGDDETASRPAEPLPNPEAPKTETPRDRV